MSERHLTAPPAPCGCLFCVGNWAGRLTPVAYEIAAAAGLVEAAKVGRVTIKPSDQLFAVDRRRAVACVRYVRRHLARLCGCWVDPGERGKGLGDLLVRGRLAYLEHHTSVSVIDTYAFRKPLFLSLGFEEKAGFKIGTTLLRKVIDRGAGRASRLQPRG
jgi:GNAT superfamily N-acetyltransferase